MCFFICVCVEYICCLWLFFFVKQKTAYEMRISDWSSDVCSSDLAAMSARNYSAALDRLVALWRVGIRDQRIIEVFQRLAKEEEEIGRASCRERVCQYV